MVVHHRGTGHGGAGLLISYQCGAENSHDCTGVGTLGQDVVYCDCYCHNVRRGMIWGALANLFTGPGWGRW